MFSLVLSSVALWCLLLSSAASCCLDLRMCCVIVGGYVLFVLSGLALYCLVESTLLFVLSGLALFCLVESTGHDKTSSMKECIVVVVVVLRLSRVCLDLVLYTTGLCRVLYLVLSCLVLSCLILFCLVFSCVSLASAFRLSSIFPFCLDL